MFCYLRNYPEPSFPRVMKCGQAADLTMGATEIAHMGEIL